MNAIPSDEVDTQFRRFCTDGDAEALGAVFAATAPWLARRAMQMVRDSAAALDLVQTTFVTAIETRHRFDVTAPARPWLLGILHNKARQQPVRRLVPAAPSAPTSDDDDGPCSEAARSELARLATRQIDRMPEPYRTVLQRALLHEETAEQIAAALGRSPATVRSQVRRGLERLRRGLPMVLSALLRAFGGTGRAAAVSAGLALVAGATYLMFDAAAAPSIPPAAAGDPAPASRADATAEPPTDPRPTVAPPATPNLRTAVAPGPEPARRELTVHVVRAIGGEPLPGVEIEVALDGGAPRGLVTDAMGIARSLADATAAQATVVAPFSSVRAEIVLAPAPDSRPGQPAIDEAGSAAFPPIRLVVPPGFAVAGEVLDASGVPAAGATIWRAGAAGATRITTADERGRFLALDLQAGRPHQLLARRDREASAAVTVIGASGTTIAQDLRLQTDAGPSETTAAAATTAATGPLQLAIGGADGSSVHGWSAVLLTTTSDDAIAVQPILGNVAEFPSVPLGALRCVLLPPGKVAANDPRLLHRHHGSEPKLLQRDGARAVLTIRGDELPSAWLQLATASAATPRAERIVLLDPLGFPRGIAEGTREFGPLRRGTWMVGLTAAGHPVEYRGPLQVDSGGRCIIDDLQARPAAVLRLAGAGGSPLTPPLCRVCLCAADAIVLLEPRQSLDGEIRVAPGDYVLFWQQEGHACSRLDLRLGSGPQQVELVAAAGDEVTFVIDYAGQLPADRIASFDLVVRDEHAKTVWRERVHGPLSAAGELRLERRFAAPIPSVLAVDNRGYRGEAAVPGQAPTVRLTMR
jgi:RNA polymerase sigma-70 factor (ECF subfamily)